METTPEEALGSNMSSDSISNGEFVHAVVKGKRTKRQRTQPPPPPAALSVAVADSSSESSAEAISGTITEEEEDMANCLILLAQGRTASDGRPKPEELYKVEAAGGGARPAAANKFTSRKFAEAATTTNGKAGVYVYECKTCNKCFPSFQALGGHRTSHKKPKLAAAAMAEEKKLALGNDMLQISMNSFSRAIPSSSQANAKPKVHECSICGSEFSSGQALGGHMRRHRPLAVAESQEAKKEKSFLSLDLNLPAPADDDPQRPPSPATFSLVPSKRPPHMFSATSASALVVDCHY